MYNVIDVCGYIICYSNFKKYGVSNLKLQKLLYFVQVFFVAYTEEHTLCFDSKIEAWDFGPVVPKAYYQYSEFSSTDIPFCDTYLEHGYTLWDAHLCKYNINNIQHKDKVLIRTVVDAFSDFSASELTKLIFNTPLWKNVYSPYMHREITPIIIQTFFPDALENNLLLQ